MPEEAREEETREEQEKTAKAVYRDALLAVADWLPEEYEIQKDFEGLRRYYEEMVAVTRLVRSALTEEALDSSLQYVQELERLADLLRDPEDEHQVRLAAEIAANIRERFKEGQNEDTGT